MNYFWVEDTGDWFYYPMNSTEVSALRGFVGFGCSFSGCDVVDREISAREK